MIIWEGCGIFMHINHDIVSSDKEVISRILEGNQTGYFSVIHKKYYPKVRDKCFSFLRNRRISDEMANDILSKAYEKLATCRNSDAFSSWLYALTYNHCIDYLRINRKLHYPDWDRENLLPEIMDEKAEELDYISYENFQKILNLIHPEEKALILMKYQDNIPLKEIGTALRITESAAKMRIKRAKARIIYLYKEKFLKKSSD